MTSSTRTLKNNASGRKITEKTSPKTACKAKDIKPESKKYGKRYKPPVPMSKEAKKAWIEVQRKMRNKESARISRQKRKQEKEDAKKEAEDWKQKYLSLKNRKEFLEKGELVSNTIDSSSGVSTGIEEQLSSKAISTGKDDKSKNKKYGIRYDPGKEMDGKELSQWLAAQRKERNKKAATNSRNKKLKEFEELQELVQYWKEKHDSLKEHVDLLENFLENLLEKTAAEHAHLIRRSAAVPKTTNDAPSYVSTTNKEHAHLQRFSRFDLNELENLTENISSMHLLSTLSTWSLFDEQGNRGGERRIPQRTYSEFMKDKKVHSFALPREDSVSRQSTSEGSLLQSSSIRIQSFNATSYSTLSLFTEQQGRQDVTTTTGMQHDNSNQTSTDDRTEEQCDKDLNENMAAKVAEMKKQFMEMKPL